MKVMSLDNREKDSNEPKTGFNSIAVTDEAITENRGKKKGCKSNG
jgi:hypothetical protein